MEDMYTYRQSVWKSVRIFTSQLLSLRTVCKSTTTMSCRIQVGNNLFMNEVIDWYTLFFRVYFKISYKIRDKLSTKFQNTVVGKSHNRYYKKELVVGCITSRVGWHSRSVNYRRKGMLIFENRSIHGLIELIMFGSKLYFKWIVH